MSTAVDTAKARSGDRTRILIASVFFAVTPIIFAVLITFFSGLLTARVSELPESAAVPAR
jgi:hypothetical protein